MGTSFKIPQILHFHLLPLSAHVTYGLMYVRHLLHRMIPVVPKSTTSMESLPAPLSPAIGLITIPRKKKKRRIEDCLCVTCSNANLC